MYNSEKFKYEEFYQSIKNFWEDVKKIAVKREKLEYERSLELQRE